MPPPVESTSRASMDAPCLRTLHRRSDSTVAEFRIPGYLLAARDSGADGRAARRRGRRRRSGSAALRRQRALCRSPALARPGLLQRVEIDQREVVREDRAELVRPHLRQVALRLDDEEARRHADVEPLSLGIEPLFRELARRARRLDALAVHLHLPRGVADLLDRFRFLTLLALRGLLLLEFGPRRVRLLDAVAERIRHAHADRPGRVIRREQLAENVAEAGVVAGSDDGAGKAAGPEHLRAT